MTTGIKIGNPMLLARNCMRVAKYYELRQG